MAKLAARRLELLALGEPLQQYARRLQPDHNASFLMVHQALARALREAPEDQPSRSLESSLRSDIDRRFVAAGGRDPEGRR